MFEDLCDPVIFILSPLQFNKIKFHDFSLLQSESHSGTLFMPTIFSGRTGVEVKVIEAFVVPGFYNVGVSADKQVNRVLFKLVGYARLIPLGMATDMSDPHPYTFQFKALVKGIALSHLCTVNVAVNGANRRTGVQRVKGIFSANITGMPYFIGLVSEFIKVRIEVAVSVG
jgi:hypothetical protein